MSTNQTDIQDNHQPVLTEEASRVLLGISKAVPMTHRSMAESLRVTFFPYGRMSHKVANFAVQLRGAMEACGVDVVPFEDAVAAGRRGKVQEGIIIIAPGTLEEGKLPVDYVPNLRTNTVVGIVDGPCPARKKNDQQEKLNTIVEALVWSIVQVIIYVDDPAWTVCTMNGAIIPCSGGGEFGEEVYTTLVPKLAAPVVPPHASDFQVEEGGLDLFSSQWEPYVRDFEESSPLWAETGVMLFHTSLSAVRFRNTYYKRVAAAYLDKRSGMSYGFLSRQPAFSAPKALEGRQLLQAQGWGEVAKRGIGLLGDTTFVVIRLKGRTLAVPMPEVAVLATRSGCDKSHVDGHRDLVLLGIRNGSIYLKTPKGLDAAIDARPSYDTLTILAHGIANSLIASVLAAVNPASPFLRTIGRSGMALAHWHGDLDPSVIPGGYVVFGEDNPPVSCSTYQAALYTLSGKLRAFSRTLEQGREYLGDVHIEPHHGINVTWPTLTGLATAILGHTAEAEKGDRERMTA